MSLMLDRDATVRVLPVRGPNGEEWLTLVDDADVPRRLDGKPRSLVMRSGYALFRRWDPGRVKGDYSLARWVLGLERGDPRQADHINRDRLDNRRSNLRIVTPGQQAQNRGPHKGTAGPGADGRHRTSQYRGVMRLASGAYRGTVRCDRVVVFTCQGDDEQAVAEACRVVRGRLLPFATD